MSGPADTSKPLRRLVRLTKQERSRAAAWILGWRRMGLAPDLKEVRRMIYIRFA